MKPYQKKFQQEWMSSDIKPRGPIRRAIEGYNRLAAKKEIRTELESSSPEEETAKLREEIFSKEEEEALYCHYYGPCRRCIDSGEEEGSC